jgi:hypothetical protein
VKDVAAERVPVGVTAVCTIVYTVRVAAASFSLSAVAHALLSCTGRWCEVQAVHVDVAANTKDKAANGH